MKAWDIVVNGWAGHQNPQKVLVVRKITSHQIHCVARDGELVQFDRRDNRLAVVGSLCTDEWDLVIEESK